MSDPLMAARRFNPVELIVLQGNSLCNLDCMYCDLSAESRRTNNVMGLELVEKLFEDLFRSGHIAPEVTIVWHSGEPLTLPPSYYEQAIDLILRHRERITADVSVRFKIQTNGVLINDDWCTFFKRHEDFLDVGVSCDGPAELHDSYRVNWTGQATHSKALRGMDLLQKNGIRYKIIAVVTKKTLAHPKEFFDFFYERRKFLSDFHFNILAEAGSTNPDLSYSTDDRVAYYDFYRRLLYLSRNASSLDGDFRILNFSQALARIMAAHLPDSPAFFEEASAPLKSISVDAWGNVTTFYAGLGIEILRDLYGDGRGLSIGNILHMSFSDMLEAEKLKWIIGDFAVSAHSCKRSCPYFAVCPGGYEITKKLTLGTFDASETTECIIHVKTLIDALLDDIGDHLDRRSTPPRAIG